MKSEGLFSVLYGRVEARIKLPEDRDLAGVLDDGKQHCNGQLAGMRRAGHSRAGELGDGSGLNADPFMGPALRA